MKILFLDDDMARWRAFNDWAIAFGGHHVFMSTNAAGAIRDLDRNTFDAVFLDHDLKEEHYKGAHDNACGCVVADAIVTSAKPFPKFIIVHSHNPEAAKVMTEWIASTGVPVAWVPFGPIISAFLAKKVI